MTWDNQNKDSASEDKVYTHSEAQSFFYTLFGVALCAGGLYLAGHFFNEVKPFFVAAFFIIILPVPMVWFGVIIIFNTLEYKITLSPDKITFKEGLSETTIDRNRIEAYRTDKDRIELKADSGITEKIVLKEFNSDPAFSNWFDGIRQVPNYKTPASEFEATLYPKVYKPDAKTKYDSHLFFWTDAFMLATAIFVGITKQPNFPNLNGEGFIIWVVIVIIPILIICSMYRLFFSIINYQVTLMPDGIEVKSLLGTTRILRQQISSYFYLPKDRIHFYNRLFVFVENNKGKNDLVIQLSFVLDQPFNDWFNGIRYNRDGYPLPKIKEDFY
jgi:hypothetical protein